MKHVLMLLTLVLFSYTGFTQPPTVNAGPDKTIQAGQRVQLNGKASHVSRVLWKTDGDGTFTNNQAAITKYKPGANDLSNGITKLTLYGYRGSLRAKDFMLLHITQCATVDIPQSSDTICANDFGGEYDIAANVTGSHYYIQWTTDGTGYFFDETAANTTYSYSASDAGSGRVNLKITVFDSAGICPPVSDSFLLKLNDPARIDLNDFGYQECGDIPVFLDGGISGTAFTVYWSTNGTGHFSENPASTTNYIPSLQDKINGSVDIYGLTNDPAGPCGASSDYTYITFTGPTLNAGSDIVACGYRWGGSIALNATLGNNVYDFTWSTNGSGWFDDEHDPNSNYNYVSSDVDNAVIQLYATGSNGGSCNSFIDTLNLYLNEAPYLEFPEPYVWACTSDPVVYANVYRYGYASSGTWTTSGTGTFDDPTSDYSAYHASQDDINNGCIDLIFTTNDPAGPCGATSGSMQACFYECFGKGKTDAITKTSKVDVQLYPNPANNFLNIKTILNINKKQTYLSDISGKILPCKWLSANSINIAELPGGVYFLHVITDKTNQIIKFVKQ